MRACLVTVLLGFAGLCWNTSPAQSQPLRTALIISNAQYANLPPEGKQDNTHLQVDGARQVAALFVAEVKRQHLQLARWLK